jgi:hypothetical protein
VREQGQLLRLLSKMNNISNRHYIAAAGRRRSPSRLKRL